MLVDLPINNNIKHYIYADDITLSSSHLDTNTARKNMSDYLKIFNKWTKDWGLKLNPNKTVLQHFTTKKIAYPIVSTDNRVITYKKTHKVLGMTLDSPTLTAHLERSPKRPQN